MKRFAHGNAELWYFGRWVRWRIDWLHQLRLGVSLGHPRPDGGWTIKRQWRVKL